MAGGFYEERLSVRRALRSLWTAAWLRLGVLRAVSGVREADPEEEAELLLLSDGTLVYRDDWKPVTVVRSRMVRRGASSASAKTDLA